ncbi:nascent polypeptide-associated complex subunit alpha isoform X1 [Castor canadensis]|uniref:Nascent polypeptide-associated complex subunit alpha isoform X1 n=1 Tax=Castor canadensis TaxID=51338 RepID=A0AC58NDQ9_CASCN
MPGEATETVPATEQELPQPQAETAVLPMSSALTVTAALGQPGPTLPPPCSLLPQQCPLSAANQSSPFPSSPTIATTPFEVPFPQPPSGTNMPLETAPSTPTFLPHLIGPPISPAALALASPMIGPALKDAHSPSAPLSLVALAPHSVQKSSAFPPNPLSSTPSVAVADSGSVTPLSAPIVPSEPKTSPIQVPFPKVTTPSSPGIVSTTPSYLVAPLATVQSGLTSCPQTLPMTPTTITSQVKAIPISSVLAPQSLKGPISSPQKTMAPNVFPGSPTSPGSHLASLHQSSLDSSTQPSGQTGPNALSHSVSIDHSSLGASYPSQRSVIPPIPSRNELVADAVTALPLGTPASTVAHSVDKEHSITTSTTSCSPSGFSNVTTTSLSPTASVILKGSPNTCHHQPLVTQIPASLGTGLKDTPVSPVVTTPLVINPSTISVAPATFEVVTCVSPPSSPGFISKEPTSPTALVITPVTHNELPTPQVATTLGTPVSLLPAHEDLKNLPTSVLVNVGTPVSSTQVGLPTRKDSTLLPLAIAAPKSSPSVESASSSLEITPEATLGKKSLVGPFPVGRLASATAASLGVNSPTSIGKTDPYASPDPAGLLLKSSITAPTVATFPLESVDPSRVASKTAEVTSTSTCTASPFLKGAVSLAPKNHPAKGTSTVTSPLVPPASESCPVAVTLSSQNGSVSVATLALSPEIPRSVPFPALPPVAASPSGAKEVDTSHRAALVPLTSSTEVCPNDSSVTIASKGTLAFLDGSPSPLGTGVTPQTQIPPTKMGSAVPDGNVSSLSPLKTSFLPEASLSFPGPKGSLNKKHSPTSPSPKGDSTPSTVTPPSPEGATQPPKDIPTPSALIPLSPKKIPTLAPISPAVTPPFLKGVLTAPSETFTSSQKAPATPPPKGAPTPTAETPTSPQKVLKTSAPKGDSINSSHKGASTAPAEIPTSPKKAAETPSPKKAPKTPSPKEASPTAASKEAPATPPPIKAPVTAAPKEVLKNPAPKKSPATAASKEAPETPPPKKAAATKEVPKTPPPKKAPATAAPTEAPATPSPQKALDTAAPKEILIPPAETPPSPKKAPAAPKRVPAAPPPKKASASTAPKEAPIPSAETPPFPKKASDTVAPKEAPIPPAETPRCPKKASATSKKIPTTAAPIEAPATPPPKKAQATAAPKKTPATPPPKKALATAAPKEAPIPPTETPPSPKKALAAPKEAPINPPPKKALVTAAPKEAPNTPAETPPSSKKVPSPKKASATAALKKAMAAPKEAPIPPSETAPSPKKAPTTVTSRDGAPAIPSPKEAPNTSAEILPSPKKAPAAPSPKKGLISPAEISPSPKKTQATVVPPKDPIPLAETSSSPQKAPAATAPKEASATPSPKGAHTVSAMTPPSPKRASATPSTKKARTTAAPKEASVTPSPKGAPTALAETSSSPKKTTVPKEAPEISTAKGVPAPPDITPPSPKKAPVSKGASAPRVDTISFHKEAPSLKEPTIPTAIAPPSPKGSPTSPVSVTGTMGATAPQTSEGLLAKKDPAALREILTASGAVSAPVLTAPTEKGPEAKKNSDSPPTCSDASAKNDTKGPLSTVAPAPLLTVPIQKDSSKTTKTLSVSSTKGKDSLRSPKGPLAASPESKTSTPLAAVAPEKVLPKAGSASVTSGPTPQVSLPLAPSLVPPLLPKQPFLPSSPGLVLELPSKSPAPADEDELPPLIPPEPISGGVPFQPVLVNMPTPKPAGIPAPTPSAKQPVLKNNKGICLGLLCAWCVAHIPLLGLPTNTNHRMRRFLHYICLILDVVYRITLNRKTVEIRN